MSISCSTGSDVSRLKSPSAVAATSLTSAGAVGSSGNGSAARSIVSGGASGTSRSCTFRPLVRSEAFTSRARSPSATRAARKSCALSPSRFTPICPGRSSSVVRSRTRLSPKRSVSTIPVRLATRPTSIPRSSTGAPAVRPPISPENTAVKRSSSFGPSFWNIERRADLSSGKRRNSAPSSIASPPATTASNTTPPFTRLESEATSSAAPPGPSEKSKPDASQNRVAPVISRS